MILEPINSWKSDERDVDSQDSHAEREPEVLLPNDMQTIWIPRMRVKVVAISENNEYPGCRAGL